MSFWDWPIKPREGDSIGFDCARVAANGFIIGIALQLAWLAGYLLSRPF